MDEIGDLLAKLDQTQAETGALSEEERNLRVKLQEKKRELAKATIEGGTAIAKLSMQDILHLFRRDAEHEPQTSTTHMTLSKEPRVLAESNGSSRSNNHPTLNQPRRMIQSGGNKPPKRKEDIIYGRRW